MKYFCLMNNYESIEKYKPILEKNVKIKVLKESNYINHI